MLNFYNDTTIKLEYNPQSNKIAFPLNVVGPSAGVTISVFSGITPSDSNSIYVAKAGNDSTGTGTAALPYLTVVKAINSCTASKIYVIIADSGTYAEDLSTVSNAYFTNIYADTGQTPILSKRILGFTPADANSIFVSAAFGSDLTGDGSEANPFASLTTASGGCDASHQKVVILDSETYTDSGIEFAGNFLGLYAQIGQAPEWEPDVVFNVTETKALTEFETGSELYNVSDVMSNDNFVIAYKDVTDSNKGKFVIYNSAGTEVKAPTDFTVGGTFGPSVAAVLTFANDSFMIVYTDGDDSKGKFVIYNSSGDEIKAITAFENNSTSLAKAAKMSNGYVVIAYRDNTGADLGKFVIYNSTGTEIKTSTTFLNNTLTYIDIAVLSNDSFVIVYNDGADSKGKFVIYNSSGTEIKTATIFNAAASLYNSIDVLSDDSFIIAFHDDGDSSKGKFIIYTSAGVVSVAVTTFYTGTANQIYIKILNNDYVIISFADADDGNKGNYVIYDSAGNLIKAKTIFETGACAYYSIALFTTDSFALIFSDTGDSSKGKFIIYQAYDDFLIKVSAAATINGIDILGTNAGRCIYLIEGTAALTIKNCELSDFVTSGYSAVQYAIYSTAAITMQHCSIHENGAGIYAEENTTSIQDSVFYSNTTGAAIHIKGAAANTGDITVEHCTVFQNYAGIKLENNQGAKEVLKNLIIHNNDNIGIEATTAATYTYSTNTDTLSGVTAGTSVLLTNPLFKNEGAISLTQIDLNLKSGLLGDTTSSPAISLADDSRDAGAYNRIIIGSATTWTAITFEKPVSIDVWTEPVTAIKNVRRDGSIVTSREALTEYVRINFNGIMNADYLEALALLQSTNSQVRIYPDPVTSPTSFNIYRYVYENINGSADHYKLTRTGKQNVNLLFGRATS